MLLHRSPRCRTEMARKWGVAKCHRIDRVSPDHISRATAPVRIVKFTRADTTLAFSCLTDREITGVWNEFLPRFICPKQLDYGDHSTP